MPKWYYHMVFDAIETGQLFNDEEEYANGMNIIAIGNIFIEYQSLSST